MSNTITLRKFEDSDLPLLKRWLYLPHVAAWYHDPLDWIEEVEKRNDKFSFLHHFIAEQSGKAIGFAQFYEYHHSSEDWHGDTELAGTYSIDYMIGDSDYLGKGLGKAIVRELVGCIEAQAGAKCIIVQPEPENKASCGTLLSCGFTYDGKNGIYKKSVGERGTK